MLRWDDDVKPMIDAATNPRDAALVAVAFDAGPRSGELRALSVGDVSDSELGMRLRLDGKTGQRTVTLVPSGEYLTRWLAAHPASDDPSAPLWSKLGEADQLSYRRFRDIFDAVADRADVEKPVTPTNFRKSNASYLARRGANAALIEDRQGRARNSQAVSRYVARFGDDDEAAQIAALHGMEVENADTAESLAPIECSRCGNETPHDEPLCVHCGQAVDAAAAEELEAAKQALREQMARSDDPAERRTALRGLETLESDPEKSRELLDAVASVVDHDSSTSSS
jgi:hypothetical protein